MKLTYGIPIACQAPIVFGSGTVLISQYSGTASQRQCCQERQSLRFKTHQNFFFMRPALYKFVMVGGEKSMGKVLLLDGFLRKLGSFNLKAQAVLLGKKLDLYSPPW